MNKAIKEILDRIEKVSNREEASYNSLIETAPESYKLLLDYITTLQEEIHKKEAMYDSLAVDYRLAQEENERLKEKLNCKEMLKQGMPENKASEYIKLHTYKSVNSDKLITRIDHQYLLNILQNGSEKDVQ